MLINAKYCMNMERMVSLMRRVKTDRNMWLLLLLNIVTCGIYSLFYWKGVEEDVNTMCAGDGKTTQNFWIAFLLGMLTCGIYQLIWLYQLHDRVYANGPRYGVITTCTGGSYLLWVLVGSMLCGIGPFIALYKSINDLNNVGHAYNNTIGY